jgi:ubiquinone/menaquinone biosynthesis C-methylase UbiE
MALFRKGGEPHALSVAMTGVRLGDRLLQIGCANPSLLGAISSKVGLSGRACILVADDAMAARARRGAERAGVLLEIDQHAFAPLPYDEAAFDLVVVDGTGRLLQSLPAAERDACLREARRVLGTRGRVVVIDPGAPSGLAALFTRAPRDPDYQAGGGSQGALTAAGFRGVRTLAERNGLLFTEGTK